MPADSNNCETLLAETNRISQYFRGISHLRRDEEHQDDRKSSGDEQEAQAEHESSFSLLPR